MRGDLIPVIVAAFVAVVGTAGIVLSFGPGKNSQQGNATLITAAAVSRAGAIVNEILANEILAGRSGELEATQTV
jgi:hypothetical protein